MHAGQNRRGQDRTYHITPKLCTILTVYKKIVGAAELFRIPFHVFKLTLQHVHTVKPTQGV